MRCLSLAFAILLAGCGTVFPLTADPSIPFAEGRVMATLDDNGTVEIDLDTLHMGDPGKLLPEATTYVVWVRPLGQTEAKPENVGAFKPNPDLKGWLTFKTKHRDIQLFVTAEAATDAAAPSSRILLKGEVTGVGAGAPAPQPASQPPPAPEQGAPPPPSAEPSTEPPAESVPPPASATPAAPPPAE